MPGADIIIVDDYQPLVQFLKERLASEGYNVLATSSGAECLRHISEGFRGIVLLDIKLPDMSGLDLFEQIKSIAPDLPVVFITAHATIDLAVEATKRGAFDFIAKGSDLLKRLHVAVKNASERLSLSEQLRTLQDQLGEAGRFHGFLTVSPRMQAILKTLDAVVNSTVTVLLEGESGTGKELIARAIHARGARRHGPFVAVNCAGIPEGLLESEMFGYEKGAFTGAVARRIGKFEAAHGGTLFLDEVGELPKTLQAKLLRVLQEHTFERVGGTETLTVDVRIVAATNKDLLSEVQKGNFREDLYYRLSAFPVHLLPLRERPEDIPLLAHHFLRRYSREEGKDLTGFSPEALAALMAHPFPGNVRELENLVRHAVIIANGPTITLEQINAALGSHGLVSRSPSPQTLPTRVLEERLAIAFPDLESLPAFDEIQAQLIKHAVNLASGNITLAARALRLGRATLYRWLKNSRENGENGHLQ